MRGLHDVVKIIRVIPPVAIGTTGTGQTGKVIDRRGYRGVEFAIAYGAITSTLAVFTPIMKEGDVTGTLTSVADADMDGTEAGAGIAAGARTSNSNKLVTKRVGYKGMKRYVSISKLSSTATAGTPVGVDAILHTPEQMPVAT
jgi:hypothetical protein